ncbi:MAG: hypothetical protein ACR2K0_01075 [Acidimicrobiales bacterium]|jgi:hypothetical protein
MRKRRERTTWHEVETIVVTGGAHLAMLSEAAAESVAEAEACIYDRARHLGTAVCVSFEA